MELNICAPSDTGEFVPVVMMVTLTRRKKEVLYCLLTHIHGREQQIN